MNSERGEQLFGKMSKRDYSHSPEDDYAQLLWTIYYHIGKQIYPLLEGAEKEGKKLDVYNDVDEITQQDVRFL